jgi:hypothetical protein
MCDICIPILGKYCRAHPKTPCPVAKALYCGGCGVYGHSPRRCPRRAEFRETRRELPGTTETLYPVEQPPVAHFEVENDEACIKAAILVNGGTPMICQEKGKRELKEYTENKKRLAAIVSENGKVLVLRGQGPRKTEASKR